MLKIQSLSIYVSLLLSVLLVSACERAPETLKFSGQTMGTTYNIVVVAGAHLQAPESLGQAIEARLARVNKHLSHWDPNSEISKLNGRQTTATHAISPMLTHVLKGADTIHRASGGAFDITLSPLVELWGFGPSRRPRTVPSDADIAGALVKIGQTKNLQLNATSQTLTKKDPLTTLDLSAIAKGYGVDAIAELLAARGFENYLVEIGGDLFARGVNARGDAWRIGIERPDSTGRHVERAIAISSLGMATSGDYRNYFEKEGIRYTHILNAKTGRPITHTTASVTVLAETAMLADGWATALLALGEEEGLKLAEKHGLAALFITKAPDPAAEAPGKYAFATSMTERFKALTSGP